MTVHIPRPITGRGAVRAARWAVGVALLAGPATADESEPRPLSFLEDVAPILVENCVGCHSSKKAESRYDLTTFTGLARGGLNGEGITLEPGDPDASYLVELIRPGGAPQMPRRLPPLKPEQVALIERWVAEGAVFDGEDPGEDWVSRWYRDQSVDNHSPTHHPVPITALTYSPDGSRIVASGAGELILSDARDVDRIERIGLLPERVEDLAYSPDGRWLAIAGGAPGRAGSALLWRAKPDGTATPDRILASGGDSFLAVAFSPDGRLVASSGTGRTIHIADVESGDELLTISDHSDWVLDLAFSPDGSRLATASRDGSSKVFEVASGAIVATFSGHAAPVHAVVFDPEGSWVATGGADGRVRIWDPDDEARQRSSPGGVSGIVLDLLVSPDGETVLAGGSDGTIRRLSPDGRSETLFETDDRIGAFALSADGGTVIAGQWDGRLVPISLGAGRASDRPDPAGPSPAAGGR